MGIKSDVRLSGACLALLLVSACGGGADQERNNTERALALSGVAAPALSASWTQLPNPNYAPPAGPYVRAWTEMTWDSVRQEIVTYGGNGPDQYQNDVWSYNVATANWTNLDPQVFCPGNSGFSKPNGTDDTAFKYDPFNNLYWAFGNSSGYRCLSYAPARTAGTGSNNSKIVDASLPSSGAYAKWRVKVGTTDVEVSAYNAATTTLTLASSIAGLGAGTSYQLYATTGAGIWYFNPSTKSWVGQDTPPGNTGPTPTAARIAPAVDYSTADKAFALFGGWGSGSDRSVWKLDVTSKAWSKLPVPSTGAPPHMTELLNSFVYDKANDVFILFGGRCSYDTTCPDNTFNGQTWAYKLSTNTWTNMAPANPPAPRNQQVMAYDSDNGVVVLFGGVLSGGVINGDTWYYHYPSNTWTKAASSASPSARFLAQVAYDPVRKQTVLFGGQDSTSERADIWGLKLRAVTGAPSVSITSPAGSSSFTAPASITVNADATDPDGSVAKVEFFANGTKIGEDLAGPYSSTWTVTSPGSYTLTAVATDNTGNATTSAPVFISVVGVNQPPAVGLTSPADGSSFTAPASVTLTASASDADGSIAKVEFFSGATKLGQATASPYSFQWTGVPAGSYSITALATDNQGATTTSTAVNISVVAGANQAPSVSLTAPANDATYTAPASLTLTANASDVDGSVSKVQFFAGATLLGQSTIAPYSLAWSNVAAGNYTLTAVATDNLGATATSAPIAISVNAATGGATVNVASSSNGAVASASSIYSLNHPASGAINGVRNCSDLGKGGVWVDQTYKQYPDWIQVAFSSAKTIDRIDVFTVPDDVATTVDPAPTKTFTLYGITAFDVQYWSGSAWITVPGGSVTGNNLVWRTFSFPAVSTDRIRVVANAATSYGFSFVCELQAWAAA